MKAAIILALCLPLSLLYSCGEAPAPAEEHGHAEEAAKPLPDSLVLSTKQQQSIDLKLGTLEEKPLTEAVKANGQLVVPNHSKAFVTPAYPGVIRQLFVHHGHVVKKGQALAVITNPQLLSMQQQLAVLQTELSLAQTERSRQEMLVKGQAAPLKNLQQKDAQVRSLQTQISGLQGQLSLYGAGRSSNARITVRAPIAGTISQMNTQLGSHVDVMTPIAEIIDNKDLHLELFVFEKEAVLLKAGQLVHFTLTNLPGKEYDARIFSVGKAVDPQTRTVPIHAEVIDEKSELIDGLNITALIEVNSRKSMALPSAAVVMHGGKSYAFLLREQRPGFSVFSRIMVQAGRSELGFTEVTPLQPVEAGVQWVTNGAFYLMAMLTNEGEE